MTDPEFLEILDRLSELVAPLAGYSNADAALELIDETTDAIEGEPDAEEEYEEDEEDAGDEDEEEEDGESDFEASDVYAR